MANHGFTNPVVALLGYEIGVEAGKLEHAHGDGGKAAAVFGDYLGIPGGTEHSTHLFEVGEEKFVVGPYVAYAAPALEAATA